MRRSKLTAGPRRVRLHVGALGLLLLSAAPFAAAHAFQVTPPDAATKAAMEKRTAARTMLSKDPALESHPELRSRLGAWEKRLFAGVA